MSELPNPSTLCCCRVHYKTWPASAKYSPRECNMGLLGEAVTAIAPIYLAHIFYYLLGCATSLVCRHLPEPFLFVLELADASLNKRSQDQMDALVAKPDVPFTHFLAGLAAWTLLRLMGEAF